MKKTSEFDIGTTNFDKIQLTKEGVDTLKARLKHLVEVARPQVQAELAEARSQGDLSENADYDAAKNKQAEVEVEIANIQDTLSRVSIISAHSGATIRIGSTVTYHKENGDNKTIQLVSSIQANPMHKPHPLIGIDTLVGKSLLGKKTGDSVIINAEKPYKVTIKKVE